MSYSEYYSDFNYCQKYQVGNYIMFAADIVDSKNMKPGEEYYCSGIIEKFESFVDSLGDDLITMKGHVFNTSYKCFVLGDFYAFSVKASADLVLIEKKFNEFLAQFPFAFHRAHARFEVADEDGEKGFSWKYCVSFLEDIARFKDIC